MVQERHTTLPYVVDTDGQPEELGFGPDVSTEGDPLVLVFSIKGRDRGMVRDLLSNKAKVVAGGPRYWPIRHFVSLRNNAGDIPVAPEEVHRHHHH